MRILWHSNAPWSPTGYGQQTALMAARLRGAGHDVAISAYWGLHGAPLSWDGFPVYPAGPDPWGNDVLAGHAAHHRADLVITLMDMWVLDPAMLRGLPAACWMPVDTTPLSRRDHLVLAEAGTAIPIAMSAYGRDTLTAAGFRPCYVPHGIDTVTFAPCGDRDECREALGVTGKFVIGINAANKDAFRKGYAEQFAAFARFHGRHPDTALAVHAQAVCQSALDLPALAAQLGILDAVVFAPQYEYMTGAITPGMLASWYGALDLYSGCSWGEGFGLPLIEAQACGVPVVTTDASAMRELCGAGWLVEADRKLNPAHQAWWAAPSVTGIARVYEKAYRNRKALAVQAARARPFAAQYDADAVFAQYWKPVLDECAERAARRPSGPLAKGQPMITEAAGLKWNIERPEDNMGPSHEDSVQDTVLGLLPDGGVFLDVGAHVGHYALRAAQTASKVIAVEANSGTAAHLAGNLTLNAITNVTLHNVAAWDTEAALRLESPNKQARDGSMRVLPGDGDVRAVPLDSILDGEPRIDLVKLDVEGADLHALRGMRGMLARCQPVMFIEDHSMYGYYERPDLDALIAELGYQQEDGGRYGGANYIIARPAPAQAP